MTPTCCCKSVGYWTQVPTGHLRFVGRCWMSLRTPPSPPIIQEEAVVGGGVVVAGASGGRLVRGATASTLPSYWTVLDIVWGAAATKATDNIQVAVGQATEVCS